MSPAALTVPGVLDAVPQVRHWLGDLLAGWLTEPDAADLALAVTEVCTNIVRHGYRDTAGDIEVRVTREAGAVHVTILDPRPAVRPRAGVAAVAGRAGRERVRTRARTVCRGRGPRATPRGRG